MYLYYNADEHEGATPQSVMPAGTTIDDYPAWSYERSGAGAHVVAWFNPKSGRVDTIECFDFTQPPTDFCQRVLGIGTGDSEDLAIATLGKPVLEAIDEKSGVKTMEYRDIGVTFLLTKTHVYGIKVSGHDPQGLVPWKRFLRWAAYK
jgi:hypothetical protein